MPGLSLALLPLLSFFLLPTLLPCCMHRQGTNHPQPLAMLGTSDLLRWLCFFSAQETQDQDEDRAERGAVSRIRCWAMGWVGAGLDRVRAGWTVHWYLLWEMLHLMGICSGGTGRSGNDQEPWEGRLSTRDSMERSPFSLQPFSCIRISISKGTVPLVGGIFRLLPADPFIPGCLT